jgi:hypothetical protein
MHYGKEALFPNRKVEKRRFFAKGWGNLPIFTRFQACGAAYNIIRPVFLSV